MPVTIEARADEGGARQVRQERLTLVAMCFGLFLIMLDNTIVNVALPSIQRELRVLPRRSSGRSTPTSSRSPC